MISQNTEQKLIMFFDCRHDRDQIAKDMKNGWNIVGLTQNGKNFVGIMEKSDNNQNPDSIYLPPKQKIRILK